MRGAAMAGHVGQCLLNDAVNRLLKIEAKSTLIVNEHVRLDAGTILEAGPPAQIFGAPHEARTRQFLDSVIKAGRMSAGTG